MCQLSGNWCQFLVSVCGRNPIPLCPRKCRPVPWGLILISPVWKWCFFEHMCLEKLCKAHLCFAQLFRAYGALESCQNARSIWQIACLSPFSQESAKVRRYTSTIRYSYSLLTLTFKQLQNASNGVFSFSYNHPIMHARPMAPLQFEVHITVRRCSVFSVLSRNRTSL